MDITTLINSTLAATQVWFDNIKMYIQLNDGRQIDIDLHWFPSLKEATESQRNNWRYIGDGEGIYWEELGEDLWVDVL